MNIYENIKVGKAVFKNKEIKIERKEIYGERFSYRVGKSNLSVMGKRYKAMPFRLDASLLLL